MHIVHLETGRHLYGGARQVLMLMNGLARQGIRVSLVCSEDSAIATAADAANINIVTLPMHGDLDPGFVRRFGAWLATADADLIHVHSRRGADLWGGLAAGRQNIPAVLSRRVDNPEPPLLGKLKYRLFDRVIAISTAIQRQLREDGVAADKIRVIHSAIDAESCQPDWSRPQFLEAFGLADADKVVACVAQLIPRKGHATLLAAWQQVVKQMPQAKLVLFGRGPEEAVLKSLASQLGLDDFVRFAGYREDLRHFLGCADLLAHPALKEGLGICLLEAQAAGLPVVATRAGGIPEALQDKETGLLVECGNPQALADALLQVLSDSELQAHMAAAGPAFVRRKFAPSAMVSGNLAVYKELLGLPVS
jgi:glycosyltransferase involved in cell wall biosynthesis